MIIDGKALALKHEEILTEELADMDIKPTAISLLIGEDPASLMYSNMKQKKAEELGIAFQILQIPDDVTYEALEEQINKLNDSSVNGIMIQLPIPEKVLGEKDPQTLLDLIEPNKDIDGLNPKSTILPATVRGVISILDSLASQDSILEASSFAVVGALGQVGRRLVEELEQKGNQVIQVDEKLPESSLDDISDVDVVISCVGEKDLIKPEHIKDGALLIDVGLGDFQEDCYNKASAYTPVKGGVGPMTIISLMENIVEASL